MKITFILGITSFLAQTMSLHAQGWEMIDAAIRRKFPEVPRIQTSTLAEELKSGHNKPLLLDVRTKAEWGVSHLPGAVRLEPGSDVTHLLYPHDQLIVTYCSVGYRSAMMARQLRADGYSKVSNLEGSIFRWANENRPLVRDGQPTEKVHPYNLLWGTLLDKSHRALDPPPVK